MRYPNIEEEITQQKETMLEVKLSAWDSMESHNESAKTMRAAMSSK